MFGGEDNSQEYAPYAAKDTNILSVYSNRFSAGQDKIRGYAGSVNDRAGVSDPTYKNALRSSVFNGNVTFNSLTSAGSGVLLPKPKGLPDNLRAPNSQISNDPMSLIKASQYKEMKYQEGIEAAKKIAKRRLKSKPS